MRITRLTSTFIAFGLLTIALCLSPATAGAHGNHHNGDATTQPAGQHHKHKHKHKHKHEKNTTKPSGQQNDQ